MQTACERGLNSGEHLKANQRLMNSATPINKCIAKENLNQAESSGVNRRSLQGAQSESFSLQNYTSNLIVINDLKRKIEEALQSRMHSSSIATEQLTGCPSSMLKHKRDAAGVPRSFYKEENSVVDKENSAPFRNNKSVPRLSSMPVRDETADAKSLYKKAGAHPSNIQSIASPPLRERSTGRVELMDITNTKEEAPCVQMDRHQFNSIRENVIELEQKIADKINDMLLESTRKDLFKGRNSGFNNRVSEGFNSYTDSSRDSSSYRESLEGPDSGGISASSAANIYYSSFSQGVANNCSFSAFPQRCADFDASSSTSALIASQKYSFPPQHVTAHSFDWGSVPVQEKPSEISNTGDAYLTLQAQQQAQPQAQPQAPPKMNNFNEERLFTIKEESLLLDEEKSTGRLSDVTANNPTFLQQRIETSRFSNNNKNIALNYCNASPLRGELMHMQGERPENSVVSNFICTSESTGVAMKAASSPNNYTSSVGEPYPFAHFSSVNSVVLSEPTFRNKDFGVLQSVGNRADNGNYVFFSMSEQFSNSKGSQDTEAFAEPVASQSIIYTGNNSSFSAITKRISFSQENTSRRTTFDSELGPTIIQRETQMDCSKPPLPTTRESYNKSESPLESRDDNTNYVKKQVIPEKVRKFLRHLRSSSQLNVNDSSEKEDKAIVFLPGKQKLLLLNLNQDNSECQSIADEEISFLNESRIEIVNNENYKRPVLKNPENRKVERNLLPCLQKEEPSRHSQNERAKSAKNSETTDLITPRNDSLDENLILDSLTNITLESPGRFNRGSRQNTDHFADDLTDVNKSVLKIKEILHSKKNCARRKEQRSNLSINQEDISCSSSIKFAAPNAHERQESKGARDEAASLNAVLTPSSKIIKRGHNITEADSLDGDSIRKKVREPRRNASESKLNSQAAHQGAGKINPHKSTMAEAFEKRMRDWQEIKTKKLQYEKEKKEYLESRECTFQPQCQKVSSTEKSRRSGPRRNPSLQIHSNFIDQKVLALTSSEKSPTLTFFTLKEQEKSKEAKSKSVERSSINKITQEPVETSKIKHATRHSLRFDKSSEDMTDILSLIGGRKGSSTPCDRDQKKADREGFNFSKSSKCVSDVKLLNINLMPNKFLKKRPSQKAK